MEQKTLYAFVAGFVVMYTLAGIWNMFLVARFFTTTLSIGEGHPIMAYVFSAYLVLSLIMAYLFPRLKIDGSWTSRGLKFGVVMGILWVVPFDLLIHGAFRYPSIALITDTLWAIIEQGLGGLVISYVYQR